jgi:hypothetical protein
MTEKRKPRATGVSPKGVFKYPKLNKPDYGSKEYPCPEGKYEVRLVLTEADPATQAFIAKLQPHYDAAESEAKQKFAQLKIDTRKKLGEPKKNDLYTVIYDKETEEPTGEIEFKLTDMASGVANRGTPKERAWTSRPAIFDASGRDITKAAPEIWGGTIGKVSFELRPYFINGTAAWGLKLALKAVQIIELVQGGQKDAKGHGFGVEDGYAHDPRTETEDDDERPFDPEATDAAGPLENADF